jgi:hypothetical protein
VIPEQVVFLSLTYSVQYTPPGELLEGYTRSVEKNPISRFFSRTASDPEYAPPDRIELDLEDPTPFSRQLFDQVTESHSIQQAAL